MPPPMMLRDGHVVCVLLFLCREPREVAVNSSCVECHPQCLQQTGVPTCHGPVSH